MKIMDQRHLHASSESAPLKGLHGVKYQAGKAGYILLWLLGVPIPVLFGIYLLRGCS